MGAACVQSHCIGTGPEHLAEGASTWRLLGLVPHACVASTGDEEVMPSSERPVMPFAPLTPVLTSGCGYTEGEIFGSLLSEEEVQAQHFPVTLNVYNVGTNTSCAMVNKVCRFLGSGAFHCAVEIMGAEWSFTDTANLAQRHLTGVFWCTPRQCPGHAYSESVSMGQVFTTREELKKLIGLLKEEWPCSDYDTLTRNCCHFSAEFCQRLGLGGIPNWTTHLAALGAATDDVTDLTCCVALAGQVSMDCCVDPDVALQQALEHYRGSAREDILRDPQWVGAVHADGVKAEAVSTPKTSRSV